LHNFYIIPADTDTNSKNENGIEVLNPSELIKATAELQICGSKEKDKEETRCHQVIIFLRALLMSD
jgi:hypothetical protein